MPGDRIHSLSVQTFALLVPALLLGTLAQFVRPHPLPWKQSWAGLVEKGSLDLGVPVATLEQARQIVDGHAHIILDARPAADYAAGHLPSAFSVPSEEIEKYIVAVMPMLTREQPVMTYCSGHECDESLKLTKYLLQNGFTNVQLFVGGFTDWTAAALPVEK